MPGGEIIEIDSWDQVPNLANEDEEHDYWSTHCLGPGVLSDMKPAWQDPTLDTLLPPPRPAAIRIQMDGDIYRRLRRLAHQRGVPYKRLLAEFVSERLCKEKTRQGLSG